MSGSTAAPPPATALDAPGNVRSTDQSDDSITLEWDEVDDAATYEVEQREPGGDWDDASCGAADADNVVSDEECVASGLDSGTDYDFRVRGVPADDDTANLLGRLERRCGDAHIGHRAGRAHDSRHVRRDGRPEPDVGRATASHHHLQSGSRIPEKRYEYSNGRRLLPYSTTLRSPCADRDVRHGREHEGGSSAIGDRLPVTSVATDQTRLHLRTGPTTR